MTNNDPLAFGTATLRPTVRAMEEVLFEPFPVLDHGFVRVVDYMGDDTAVVQAARVSYGKGTKQTSEDRGLINYLMRHSHTTPFEMCELKLHVKMPIFVARQWIRHRMASINEYSARYSELDNEFYVPTPGQLATQSKSNAQGRAEVLTGNEALRVLHIIKDSAQEQYDNYRIMLDGVEPGDKGLSRELARIGLGLNFYTQFYWKIDLHNLMKFLGLRADGHAQYEIRAYAEQILDLVRRWVPVSYDAFAEHQLNATKLSASGTQAIKLLLSGKSVAEARQLVESQREWNDIAAQFGLEQAA